MRVGIEVGGTFTDLIALDGDEVRVTKVPSVPRSPEEGVFAALAAADIPLSRITDLVHGSTVATNAVLERKGGLTAFVTTAGFRDLLLIQRQDRPKIYTLSYQKPAAVVERREHAFLGAARHARHLGDAHLVAVERDEVRERAADFDPDPHRHSILRFIGAMILRHISVSSAIIFPNCAGDIELISEPSRASCSVMGFSCAHWTISRFSLSTTACGVPAGAMIPYQE